MLLCSISPQFLSLLPTSKQHETSPYRPNPLLRNSHLGSELESRGFVLCRTISNLNMDHLKSVFVTVGFPTQEPNKIKIALENTNSLLWIEYKKWPVVFAKQPTTTCLTPIVWDVVVDPSFQGTGLGKAVMERLIDELLDKGICNIELHLELPEF